MIRSNSDITKHLKKCAISTEVIIYIRQQLMLRDERIEAQSRALELLNRKALPINERYLSVEHVDSSSSKVTINPCDGRVSIKISNKVSTTVHCEMLDVVQMVMMDDTIPPVTMRGKIIWHDDKYILVLQSASKKFIKRYELEGESK